MSGVPETKRQRYISLYVLLSKEEDINGITSIIDATCRHYSCSYAIRRSFLTNFFYIKISCTNDLLEEVKRRLEVELNRCSDAVSWIKAEVIEVK